MTTDEMVAGLREAVALEPEIKQYPDLCAAILAAANALEKQPSLTAERDAAKVAGAKDREQLGRALDKQAEYLAQCQAVVAERDAIADQNAALRAALEKIRDRAKPLGLDRGDSVTMLIAESALALTPPAAVAAAQSREEKCEK